MALVAGARSIAAGFATKAERPLAAAADGAGVRTDTGKAFPWTPYDVRQRAISINLNTDSEAIDVAPSILWGLRESVQSVLGLVWGRVAVKDAAIAIAWGKNIVVERSFGDVWIFAPAKDIQGGTRIVYGRFKGTDDARSIVWARGNPRDTARAIPNLELPPKDQSTSSPYDIIGDPAHQPPPSPPPFVIVRPGVYVIRNSITATSLATGVGLHVDSVKLSLDLGSWAWSLEATIPLRASLLEILPDEDGPKRMAVLVNGWRWEALVEGYSEDRRRGASRWNIRARGPGALLAAPNAEPRSYVETAALSAAQLADQEVAFTGFTIDWDTVDWTVPAGAWSYQDATPIEALTLLAQAVGAVIVPHREQNQLTIQPRYIASPWSWGSTPADKTIAAALIPQIGSQWSPKPAYNAVWISGRDQGVRVKVKRTGTAGDYARPSIVDPLITAAAAGTERGRNELSAGGRQANNTLELPLFPDLTPGTPGLVTPGQLLEVADGIETWKALVTSTAIAAERSGNELKVTQTLGVERHYGDIT